MKKYRTSLVIGRFQPLHKGHIYLIKKACAITNNCIIGIGSANIKNYDNPFTVEERTDMLKNALEKEGLLPHVLKIVTLDDYHNDTLWLTKTIEKIGHIDIVLGNNDLVNHIFSDAGYPTMQIPYYKREIYEGKKIRENMRRSHMLKA